MSLTAKFKVSGMNCHHCSNHVQSVISEMQGVKKAQVNLEAHTLEVEYDPGVTMAQDFVYKMKDTPFTIEQL